LTNSCSGICEEGELIEVDFQKVNQIEWNGQVVLSEG
jgi:hypothetical protein